MKKVYVVGTADTKGDELAYLARAVAESGAAVTTVDVGTKSPTIRTDVEASAVAACGGSTASWQCVISTILGLCRSLSLEAFQSSSNLGAVSSWVQRPPRGGR